MAKARKAKWAIAALVVLGLLAGGLWFAGQGPFLEWVLRRAVSASEGRLTIDNARGSLYSGIQFERLTWTDRDSPTIAVRDGELSWRIGGLLDRQLYVPLIKARSLQLQLAPSSDKPDKPTELPESLQLPIALQIDDVVVNNLTIVPAPSDGKPATPVELQGVRLALSYRDGRYNLQRMAMTTQWGTFEANAQLDDTEPFLLSAETRMVAQIEGLADPIPAQLAIGGSMDLLQARGSAQLGNALVRIGALMRPTADQPFGPIRFEASGIELRRFAETAPEARFRLTGVVEPKLADSPLPAAVETPSAGATRRSATRSGSSSKRSTLRAPPSEPGGVTLTGHVDLVNEMPGRLDESKLPVSGASTRFDLHGDALKLIDTTLSFGQAGVIGGGGVIDLAKVGSVSGSPFTGLNIDLRVSDVDIAQLHNQMARTRLAGSVKATDAGVAVDINDQKGELLAGGLGLRGVFNLQDQRLTIRDGVLRARDGAMRVSGAVGLDGDNAFDLKGSAERFEPQRWIQVAEADGGRFLRGRLNGQWAASGKVKPTLDARVSLKLNNSRLNDLPLSGRLQAELVGPPVAAANAKPAPGSFATVPGDAARAAESAGKAKLAGPPDTVDRADTAPAVQRLRNVNLQLSLGGTKITAKGGLGLPGDRLAVTGAASALAELDPRLAGSLQLDGELRDTFADPAVRGQWRGNGLRIRLPAATSAPVAGTSVANAQKEATQHDGTQPRITEASNDSTGNAPRVPASVETSAASPVSDAPTTILINATRGSIDVVEQGRRRLNLQANAEGIDASGVKLDAVTLNLDGALPEHTFRASVSGAGQRLATNGSGQFDEGRRVGGQSGEWSWNGKVNSLDVSGVMQASLQRPATVHLRPDAYAIDGLSAALAGGRLRINNGRFEQGRVAGKGDFDDIAISRVLQAIERWTPGSVDPALIKTIDVVARGRFDVNGSGVQDLTGSVGLDLDSRNMNSHSSANIALAGGELNGKLALDVPSLAWTRQMLGDEWRIDGALAFDGEVLGRVTAPRLVGDLKGDKLRLVQRLLGWRLSDGVLRARFDTNRLQLKQMRFASANGAIDLKGQLALPAAGAGAAPPGMLDLGRGDFLLTLDRLPLSIGPGQRVTLSGATPILIEGSQVRWTGKVRVDEGLVELRDIDGPTEPGDLVVIDRRKATAKMLTPDERKKAKKEAPPVRMIADLDFDVGDKLHIVGNGIDAWLRGAIRISGELPKDPEGHGTIFVREGKYRGYGQDLAIENGRIIFNGALDNPALDIVAVRRYLPVEAGVAIAGNAQAPRIRLVSKPEVPDAEKLSWMILGVPLSDAGGGTVALKAAAATLFGNSDKPSSGGLSELLGVDVIGISSAGRTGSGSALPSAFTSTAIPGVPGAGGVSNSSSTAQQNVVTVGKRLSSRLFVSYEQGLQGVWNLLKIQYDINRRLSLRASTGSESAVDLLYFHLFD